MDYTQSNSFATDAATTNRMHMQAQAVPTAVSDNDMNMLIWSMMEVVRAGGLTGAQFDRANPATYQKFVTALRAAGVFTTAAALDNTTKAATTAFVRNELLSLGSSVYSTIFGGSKTANGYQKVPGGLIFQWGSAGINRQSTVGLAFPIAFPTNVFFVIAGLGAAITLTTNEVSVGAQATSLSAFNLSVSSSVAGISGVWWLACGN